VHWLPEPPPGTSICLGFDGSDVSDHTVIRAETREGLIFTPRWGPDRLPTHWDPAEWNGLVPRSQVTVAVDELFERFDVRRMYCDPPRWETDVESWRLAHGETVVQDWPTYRASPMFASLIRFVADLAAGRVSHDGCPLTAAHMANARKIARGGDKYLLGKPSENQKIDAAMGVVLAHEAAADERAAGWPEKVDSRVFCFS
jgi:phage terminase large subunit-like protein